MRLIKIIIPNQKISLEIFLIPRPIQKPLIAK